MGVGTMTGTTIRAEGSLNTVPLAIRRGDFHEIRDLLGIEFERTMDPKVVLRALRQVQPDSTIQAHFHCRLSELAKDAVRTGGKLVRY